MPFLVIFKEPQLRKNVILTILLYVNTYIIFDGHCRNIENLDFSIYISFTISSFLELPSDLLSIVGMDYIGRRWSSAISLALSGIFLLPCAWIQGWYSEYQVWICGLIPLPDSAKATRYSGIIYTLKYLKLQPKSFQTTGWL